MSDDNEILLKIMELNWIQARQMEDQRATITGLIVIVTSAIQGGLTQTGLNKNALPLTIMLIILGAFGVIASLKLYERFHYNFRSFRDLRKRLEELNPNTQMEKVLNNAYNEHLDKFPFLSKRVNLNVLWIGLNAIIGTLGIIYTIIIII